MQNIIFLNENGTTVIVHIKETVKVKIFDYKSESNPKASYTSITIGNEEIQMEKDNAERFMKEYTQAVIDNYETFTFTFTNPS